MPRRPRIQLDNVALHIVQRGHNREACFLGVEDYQSYLHWLEEALHNHDWSAGSGLNTVRLT
jgi:putative transposase